MPEQKPVVIARGDSLETSGGQSEGMIRQNALTNLTDGICASRMIAKPHSGSAIHHHGELDTSASIMLQFPGLPLFMTLIRSIVVFAFSGRGTIVSDGGKTRQDLAPGDYALIPAFAEHQEVNDGDEDVVWCIVRSGREPVVVNLPGGWGTSS